MAIALLQIDDELWVNPKDIVAVYSEEGMTFISTGVSEFEVADQSVAAVVGRLSEFLNLYYEE